MKICENIMILAVIQAKMNSSRLSGKVMLPLLGKPVIYRIYERLNFSKKLDEICISTSTDPLDDPIAKYAKENGIKCFRGSNRNVVDRHLSAAKLFNADVIVRITADCPIIDPTNILSYIFGQIWGFIILVLTPNACIHKGCLCSLA